MESGVMNCRSQLQEDMSSRFLSQEMCAKGLIPYVSLNVFTCCASGGVKMPRERYVKREIANLPLAELFNPTAEEKMGSIVGLDRGALSSMLNLLSHEREDNYYMVQGMHSIETLTWPNGDQEWLLNSAWGCCICQVFRGCFFNACLGCRVPVCKPPV